jgi:hypothetical protein
MNEANKDYKGDKRTEIRYVQVFLETLFTPAGSAQRSISTGEARVKTDVRDNNDPFASYPGQYDLCGCRADALGGGGDRKVDGASRHRRDGAGHRGVS